MCRLVSHIILYSLNAKTKIDKIMGTFRTSNFHVLHASKYSCIVSAFFFLNLILRLIFVVIKAKT